MFTPFIDTSCFEMLCDTLLHGQNIGGLRETLRTQIERYGCEKKKQRQTNVQCLIADSVLDERVLSSPGVTSWDLDVFGLCV